MNNPKPALLVILPVFNEAASLNNVVSEWLAQFRVLNIGFELCLINDGSTDPSLEIISKLAQSNDEVTFHDKSNTGHGQTCIVGYQMAIDRKFQYVFQIDSDGQCDPRYFEKLWRQRNNNIAIFGTRCNREDSVIRIFISRLLAVVIKICSGVYIPDANVPYRLIQTRKLQTTLDSIPKQADLTNLFVALDLHNRNHINWVEIGFRKRTGGTSGLGMPSLAKKCLVLIPQLLGLRSDLQRARK